MALRIKYSTAHIAPALALDELERNVLGGDLNIIAEHVYKAKTEVSSFGWKNLQRLAVGLHTVQPDMLDVSEVTWSDQVMLRVRRDGMVVNLLSWVIRWRPDLDEAEIDVETCAPLPQRMKLGNLLDGDGDPHAVQPLVAAWSSRFAGGGLSKPVIADLNSRYAEMVIHQLSSSRRARRDGVRIVWFNDGKPIAGRDAVRAALGQQLTERGV